jgi:hypothetical protein
VDQQRKKAISTEWLGYEVCPRGGEEDQIDCESLGILFLAKSGLKIPDSGRASDLGLLGRE